MMMFITGTDLINHTQNLAFLAFFRDRPAVYAKIKTVYFFKKILKSHPSFCNFQNKNRQNPTNSVKSLYGYKLLFCK